MIRHMKLHHASFQQAMWKNSSASSSIERTQLSGHDSHPNISSEPLIEDEESNIMVTPNFSYNGHTCSSTM